MKENHLPHVIFSTIFATIVTVLLTNFILFASEKSGQNITIMATVRPQRIIIIDDSLVIQKIISNTSEDIRPIVTLNTADGKEVPFTRAIQAEYAFLKPSLDFSKPAVIYEREDRPVQALFKRVYRTVGFISPF